MQIRHRRRHFHKVMIVTAVSFLLGTVGLPALASSADALKAEAALALKTLCATHPQAQQLATNAHAILVYPKIVKAGVVFGGGYGEGVMTRDARISGYYNSVTPSWEWQDGAESYGYVVFLMNEKAVKFLNKTDRWEIGVGPSVMVVSEEQLRSISSANNQDDAYAFIFDQQGLIASLNIEGTRISQIRKS